MDAKSEEIPPIEGRPWKRLEDLAVAGNAAEIAKFLEELPAGEVARVQKARSERRRPVGDEDLLLQCQRFLTRAGSDGKDLEGE